MPGGRPIQLTPEVLEDVRRLLPTVLYLETVADYIGVSRRAVQMWLRRGSLESRRLAKNSDATSKESEAVYLEFFRVYKRALAEGEIYDAGIIKKAAATQWQAAAWRLERRFPLRWARREVQELAALKAAVEQLEKSFARRSSQTGGSHNRPHGRISDRL